MSGRRTRLAMSLNDNRIISLPRVGRIASPPSARPLNLERPFHWALLVAGVDAGSQPILALSIA